MSMQRLATWGGDMDYRSTESEITDGRFYGFTVNEDGTSVLKMTGGPDGNIPSPALDFRSASECNITGKSLFKGQLITIDEGYVIKNFDLSAGSVTLHKPYRK